MHLLVDLFADQLQLELLSPHCLSVGIQKSFKLAGLLVVEQDAQCSFLLIESITISGTDWFNLMSCLAIFELIILFKGGDEITCLVYLASSRIDVIEGS